jgi:hypothetical protein
MKNIPKPNINKAFERAEAMQDPEFSCYHKIVGYDKEERQNKSSTINNKRDKFHNKLVPNSISRVNTFMDKVGVDINDTIFAGGDQGDMFFEKKDRGYVNSSNTRLIPKQHEQANFEELITSAQIRNYYPLFSGNTRDGLKYMQNNGGTKIELRESQLFAGIENLTNEQFHQIVFGEQYLRRNMFGENDSVEMQQKLEHAIVEGTVELFKQITFIHNDEFDANKTYKKEVSFMVHLAENVAEILGRPGYPNYKLALKFMVTWAYKGGENSRFVELCKRIKTTYFPKGFDIYSVDSDQMRRLEYLMANNKYDFNKVKKLAEGLN